MRKLACLAICFAAITVFDDAAAGVQMLRPEKGTRMWLPVSGRTRLYYRLEPAVPTVVPVKGPGKLKCIVRVIPGATDAPTIAYSVEVREGDHRVRTIRTESVPSDLRFNESGEVATLSRSFSFSVGRGNHNFRFVFKSETAVAAAVRFVFRPREDHSVQTAIQPASSKEAVTVVVNESPRGYYVADSNQPVELNIIGPTRLRVISRLIYPERARGEQSYTIRLSRDGVAQPNKTFKTTKSSVAECEVHPEWVLGQSKSFYIDIPKGANSIVLRLADTYAPNVAFRFLIPKEDMANGR